MSLLDFLLVAGMTAVVVFVAAGLVLQLTAMARKRGRAADTMTEEVGRAEMSD